ncbi:MAG: heavy-metal-associated domain-containing protein [Lentisphaerae bacterium]|nr:heavy-metal-associated domain-containing protein [Lentisphaerota bacterium]
MPIRTALTAVIVAGLLAGCASSPPAEQTGNPAGGVLPHGAVVLTVHGLSCPLCSNNLDGQLRRLAGVEEAVIDLNTGAVTVTLADGHAVTRETLAGAVEQAGFTLKDVQPAEPGP